MTKAAVKKRRPSKGAASKELKAKEVEVKRLTEENAELTATLQRLQAEFENFRKRSEREMGETGMRACGQLLQHLLPLMDSFESSLAHQEKAEALAEGFKHIHKQFRDVLASQGVQPMKAAGKPFDPMHHEVLLRAESDKDRNVVLEELQKGYFYKDKVLRHAKVKVSAGPVSDTGGSERK